MRPPMRFLTSRTPHRGQVGSGSSRTRFSHRGNDGTHPCRTAVRNTLFIVVCNLRTLPPSRLLRGRDGLSLARQQISSVRRLPRPAITD